MAPNDESIEQRMYLLDLAAKERRKLAQIQELERLKVERVNGEVWELEVEASVPTEDGFAVALMGTARRVV